MSSFPPTTDPNGVSFFELRRYTSNLAIATGSGAQDIAFNEVAGDRVYNRVVNSTGISIKTLEARRYRITGSLEFLSNTSSSTLAVLTCVTSGGRTFTLWKGTVPGSASPSVIVPFCFMLPIGVVTGAKETFKFQLNPATVAVNMIYGSATNRTSFVQVEEFVGYPSDVMDIPVHQGA